ncbi:MAG: YraN family protein [Hyphomicrobiaceae bacterium]|nr:YraN family protein [Hyphomicrobiaceae bacterium]
MKGPSIERQRRYRRGVLGEWAALLALLVKGYRPIGRRVATHAGEIDLIVVRRRRLAFVEVKRRGTVEAAEASIGTRQRQRIRRAADIWLGRHARYVDYELGFDLVLVVPRRWPLHLRDAL